METIACINCGTQTPAREAAYRSGLCGSCVDAPAPPRQTTVTRTAFQLAAALVTINALLVLYTAYVIDSYGAILVGPAIDTALALGLLAQNNGARIITLIRAVLGLVLWGGLQLARFDGMASLEQLVVQLVFCATLIVLLTGTTRPWRLGVGYVGVGLIGIYYGMVAYAIS